MNSETTALNLLYLNSQTKLSGNLLRHVAEHHRTLVEGNRPELLNLTETEQAELAAKAGTKHKPVKLDQNLLTAFRKEHSKLNIGKHPIRSISILDPEYRTFLKSAEAAPVALQIVGTLETEDPTRRSLGTCGTRNIDLFGEKTSFRAGKTAAELNLEHISGLADGSDITAHKAAIEHGGTSIGALGSGLGNIRRTLQTLLPELLDTGRFCAITEHAYTTPGVGHRLMARNRLIASATQTVLCQSNPGGGSMHTVTFALNTGKHVIVPVPSEAWLKNSLANKLLNQTEVLQDPEQIAKLLNVSKKRATEWIRNGTLQNRIVPVKNQEELEAAIRHEPVKLENLQLGLD